MLDRRHRMKRARPDHGQTESVMYHLMRRWICYAYFVSLAAACVGPLTAGEATYFPPPESQGGWRQLDKPEEIRRLAGMDPAKLAGLRE